MAVSNDYLHFVLEQLSGLDQVSSRRMFSGLGLYCGELFFGLIFGDTLYFKVDDSNRPDYQMRGMSQFRPYANKPRLSMNYYEVPVDILEDGEQLVAWARKSVTVAESAAAKARPRIRKVTLKER
jgi:DNA transformation protein and related proteins